MFSATRVNKGVEEFWLRYFMRTTNLKDYILEDKEEFGEEFRDTMKCQVQHELYNKSSGNQLEYDETDISHDGRIKFWMIVVDRGGPIPNNIFD